MRFYHSKLLPQNTIAIFSVHFDAIVIRLLPNTVAAAVIVN